jgi:large subunit ribosomal protein L4
MRVALSAKAREGKLRLIDDFELESHKTGSFLTQVDAHSWESALLVTAGRACSDNLRLATRHLSKIDVLPVLGANVYDIVRRRELVLTKSALHELTERLTKRL